MRSESQISVRVLVIDDDPQLLDVMVDAISEEEGIEVDRASDAEEGLELFKRHRHSIVLADYKLPSMHGMELLDRVLAIDPGVEFILVTGHYTTELAVQAIQKGAADYLTKPISIAVLRSKVGQYIEQQKRRQHASTLDSELLKSFNFEGMIGRSPQMLEVFTRIKRVAPHFQTVLVAGPTGTGKELVARALHRLSPVASRPLAVCNCAAVVETLFESELFGYVKGAFTGATQDKIGLFEYANGGVVFLDEIGEMPLAAQAKLLRVLQNQEIQRVGSPATRKIEIKVIAATNRDLKRQVGEKTFREDLYYRLSMVQIQLPRLAERREDLVLLQKHFVEHFSRQYSKPIKGISRRAQTKLAEYFWPGNIRELENVIGNACMMTQSDVVDIHDLPEAILSRDQSESDDDLISFEVLQRRYAQKVLNKVGGNKQRAAEILGVSRTTLYKILGTAPEEPSVDGISAQMP
jgi:DNA-binding NtrC family response regulator